MNPLRYVILVIAALLVSLCIFIAGIKFGSSWAMRSTTIRAATMFQQIALLIRANKTQEAQDWADSEVKTFLPLISETSNSAIFRNLPGTNIAGARTIAFLEYFSKFRPMPAQLPKDFFMNQPDMSKKDQIKMTSWLDSAHKNDAAVFAMIDAHLQTKKKAEQDAAANP